MSITKIKETITNSYISWRLSKKSEFELEQELLAAIKSKNNNLVKLIVPKRLNPNVVFKTGFEESKTPIIMCGIENNLESLNYLISLGGNVEQKDISQRNALWYALVYVSHSNDIPLALIKAGGDVNNTDINSSPVGSFIMRSTQPAELIREFISHGYDINQEGKHNFVDIAVKAYSKATRDGNKEKIAKYKEVLEIVLENAIPSDKLKDLMKKIKKRKLTDDTRHEISALMESNILSAALSKPEVKPKSNKNKI